MAITTGNVDEVKLDEDVSTGVSTKKTETKVEKPKKEEPKVEVKEEPKVVSSEPVNPTAAAIVFIAQRALDQPGFEDFKMLYPGLFK